MFTLNILGLLFILDHVFHFFLTIAKKWNRSVCVLTIPFFFIRLCINFFLKGGGGGSARAHLIFPLLSSSQRISRPLRRSDFTGNACSRHTLRSCRLNGKPFYALYSAGFDYIILFSEYAESFFPCLRVRDVSLPGLIQRQHGILCGFKKTFKKMFKNVHWEQKKFNRVVLWTPWNRRRNPVAQSGTAPPYAREFRGHRRGRQTPKSPGSADAYPFVPGRYPGLIGMKWNKKPSRSLIDDHIFIPNNQSNQIIK